MPSFLIWDSRDAYSENTARWWRAKGAGYTRFIEDAGRFTERPPTAPDSQIMVPEEWVLDAAQMVVSEHRLMTDMGLGKFPGWPMNETPAIGDEMEVPAGVDLRCTVPQKEES